VQGASLESLKHLLVARPTAMMPLLDRLLPDVLQRLDERHTIVRDGANAILTTVKSIWTADIIVAALIKVVEINHSKVRAATPPYHLCSVVGVGVRVYSL
jgi:hypothetical protein